MRQRIINFLYRHKSLLWLLWAYHRIIGRSRIIIRGGNYLQINNSNFIKSVFECRKGNENTVIFGTNTFMSNSKLLIKGSNNRVEIGSDGFINGLVITVEGDNNKVYIGDKVFVLDDTRMIAVDGSTLHIGNECMFSDRIDIRTTDNHAIIDMDTSKRINFEEDITIGDKVWIGTGVNILKGSVLPDGTIVGARSVVTKQYQQNNSVIVGNPARVVRNNVRWTMER